MSPMPEDRRRTVNHVAAIAHAAHGRPVFPCSKTKQPAIPKKEGGRGLLDATTDRKSIDDWWARYPGALVGMATGSVSGVWVLDVDVHGGEPGEESLADLCTKYGPLPETVVAMTPSGGMHWYFRHPRGGVAIPNSSHKLGRGLDVRGDGGYVIVPPSVLPDGRSYEWEGSSDPGEGARAADAPAWLLDMVVKREEEAPATATAPSGEGEEIVAGGRNEALFSLGRSLRAKGLTAIGIEAALLAENTARCLPPLPDDEVRRTAASAASKPPGRSTRFTAHGGSNTSGQTGAPPDLRVVGGTECDDRPSIEVVAGKSPQAVDELQSHLIAGDAGICQHGTRLVRVGRWSSSVGPVVRPLGVGILVDISPEWLADKATRMVLFKRFDKRKNDWVRVDCPGRFASTLLAKVGEWVFPVLVGFCDSPTLDLFGRIVSKPGYDAQSGLFLVNPPTLPPMGEIDRHAAERAAERIAEAVETFPFVSHADVSACIALIITALLRRVLPSSPLGCVSATTPGTGKSKLVDVISAIASGRQAAVMAIGHTPEELEKRLDAVLLKGDCLSSFDNVDRPVKSDVLCQAATQPAKTVRVLGLSKTVEAPTNVLLLLTGNNLTLVGDLVRRCVVVNLDVRACAERDGVAVNEAECERPELREFERDAVEHVLERRGELIAAALTISKAYLDAGRPDVRATPFGGFELWDSMVRRPLMWAGMPDPLKPAEAMRDKDHELAGMAEFLAAWSDIRTEAVSSAALSALVRERSPQIGEGYAPLYPALTEAAVEVMGDLSRWSARDLGYRLRTMQGRLFSGRRIVKERKSRGGALWRVESITV